MGKNRTLTSVLAVSALTLTLMSCSAEKPAPDDAAAALAEGLSKADLSASSFTAGTPAQINTELQTLLEGMGTVRPAVTVAGIEEDPENDDAAAVRLAYAWDVNMDSAPDWTYESTARLSRGENDTWQVQWAPSVLFDSLADGDRLVRTASTGLRADILDRNGQPLMGSRPVLRIGINKPDIPEDRQGASATALAELAGLDPAGYAAQVAASGPEAFVEAIVQREEADGPVTPEALAGIPGALSIPDSRVLAPTRTFARALLGTVGEATAELIEESGGRLSAGNQTGLSGLQQQYDEQLQGAPGAAVTLENTSGANIVFSINAEDGMPLQTTLDPGLQTLAEGILADEPSASALVAVQPSTGDVLTVANGPGSEGQQTALLGQYPPGSTFKIATSLALLRQGVTPDSSLSCPAELSVDGRKFNNASSYPAAFVGDIPLRDAFAQSCNTAFINTRDTVPQDALASAAEDLGIGVSASMGVPAFFGSVPEDAEGTAHAASMIGQGEILVSPLALAVAAASVGKGERVTPLLVTPGAGTQAPGAATETASAPASASASAAPAESDAGSFTAAEASSLRELMRGVVTGGGAAMLSDVPGEPVLAKTGTAEFGSETPPRTHAWVVAVQGDLAVAVFVAEGELGSTSGGPLMQAFLDGAAGRP
ncbi:penicillin-binding transpeptidase domain-containing protein [Arthrobacter sp. APC 3897]|uniref:penicillin-binding transpeptidase domain-containing protein n=1 Tax=Arthrobacter sp. APC 3897 TaxID=3035204 RepID=UPI0025B4A432|nr:penicillin-binding transpeptidase domain-containing protein [Arthrobacter sp. APC 3897]MDN3481143.1 penicillin-binding transpeptidase domain-containing protein [Arthrobacter sp. APC 3897]